MSAEEIKKHIYLLDRGAFFRKSPPPDIVDRFEKTINGKLTCTVVGSDTDGYPKISECIIFEDLEDFMMFKLKYGDKIKDQSDIDKLFNDV